MEEEIVQALQTTPVRPGQGATGQMATVRAPVQVANILEEREYTGTRVRPMLARLGYRSVLAVPLLREERIMGALTVWRKEAGSFSSEIVNLLQTFATQSALAIQNARLFREIEEKSKQIERLSAQAVAWLRRGSPKSFSEIERLQKDPDLEPLRGRPEFQKLIQELSKGK